MTCKRSQKRVSRMDEPSDQPQVSRGDEILATCQVYRFMFATHGMLRNMGFAAKDIFSFVGANAGVQLRAQGKMFTITCCSRLPRAYADFAREWRELVATASTVSDAMLSRMREEWLAQFGSQKLPMAIMEKGIQIPFIEARRTGERH